MYNTIDTDTDTDANTDADADISIPAKYLLLRGGGIILSKDIANKNKRQNKN